MSRCTDMSTPVFFTFLVDLPMDAEQTLVLNSCVEGGNHVIIGPPGKCDTNLTKLCYNCSCTYYTNQALHQHTYVTASICEGH